MKLSLVFSTLCGLTLSAVTPKGTPFNTTFDDIPGSALLPELKLPPVPYSGGGNLAYYDFAVFETKISRVKAPSPKQVGVGFIGEFLFSGRLKPNITSLYPGSKVPYFDLKSTQLACTLATQTGLFPVQCIVTFAGKTKAGSTVTHDCSFSGGDVFEACELPKSFSGLTSVVQQFNNALSKLSSVFFLDNINGVSYQ